MTGSLADLRWALSTMKRLIRVHKTRQCSPERLSELTLIVAQARAMAGVL